MASDGRVSPWHYAWAGNAAAGYESEPPMSFSFDAFVDAARNAASEPGANLAVRDVLRQWTADPDAILRATPDDGEDEVLLFEDETVSVWRCLFRPHVVMPPHEHRLDVHIATYAGAEKNILFERRDGKLQFHSTNIVEPGDILSLNEDCIHAVTAEGDRPSQALHVYMGPLMQLDRGLFDWDSGERIEFTLAHFDAMKRSSAELPDYGCPP